MRWLRAGGSCGTTTIEVSRSLCTEFETTMGGRTLPSSGGLVGSKLIQYTLPRLIAAYALLAGRDRRDPMPPARRALRGVAAGTPYSDRLRPSFAAGADAAEAPFLRQLRKQAASGENRQ